MRGGRDLTIEDFEKKRNDNYTNLFREYESKNKQRFMYLGVRHKTNNHKKIINDYNNELQQLRISLHYHVKIEEKNNILYIYFGTIAIAIEVNKTGYKNYYKYVIITNEQNEVMLLQLNQNGSITNVTSIDDELKDYLLKLYSILGYNPKGSKLRIQNFIKEILEIKNESAYSISNEQINSPAQVRSEPKILSNGSIKYPANYVFSGKINDNYFNTNENFRDIGTGKNRIPRKLYKYNPKDNSFELLLTELDYLVNIYDNKGNPVQITYSGVYNSTPIYAGKKKIPIKDINHYLYTTKKFPDGPCWIISLN